MDNSKWLTEEVDPYGFADYGPHAADYRAGDPVRGVGGVRRVGAGGTKVEGAHSPNPTLVAIALLVLDAVVCWALWKGGA